MPINVDTVYQTVQALANKEQRGYLTPQEFNLFANQVQVDKISDLLSSKWHQAAFTENVYFEDGYNRIQVWNGAGAIGTGVTCETVTGAPDMVFWNYLVINEKPVYDMTSSANFSLHASEQSDVVMKVLKLAGVSIEDSGLYQSSSQEDQQNQQQENK